jgi:hypothetical protein
MANVDSAFGLRPIRYLNGAPWNGQCRRYLLPSSDTSNRFIGDPVTLGGDAGASALVVNGIPAWGLPTCAILTPGAGIVGVIVGFEVKASDLTILYGPASENRIALVVDDPNVVFEVQEVSGGTALTSTEVGLNANLVSGTGSTSTGISGWELNNSGEATTVTLDVKILGLVQREDNDYGEHAKWEVIMNHHRYRAGSTGV